MRRVGHRWGTALARVAIVGVIGAAGGVPAYAQTGGYTGSVHFVHVDTAEGERADAWFLLNGVDVERGIVRGSVLVPFIAQRSAWAVADEPSFDTPWTSGVGDPFVRVDVTTWRSASRDAALRFSASAKVPLASVDDGLSSGKFDYAVGMSYSAFRGRQSLLADLTYWVLGDPAGADYRNIATFYVGYGRVLDSRYRWSAIVSASGSPAILPGGPPSAQWSVAVVRVLSARASVGASLDVGLTDGAADLALGGTWRLAF